jgi:hypothetical protein
MAKPLYLSLVVYTIRFNTVYNRLAEGDLPRALKLFERYSSTPDHHILPREIDDELTTRMFLGEIYATLGMLEPCKEHVMEAIGFIDNYKNQHMMLARRMSEPVMMDDARLGTLNKLPEGCLYQIANEVVHALC